MLQQFICFQLNVIQETPLIGTDIIRAYGYAKFFDQGFRQITYAVGRDHKGASLRLFKDQDVFANFRLAGFFTQIYKFFGQNV